MAEGDRPTGTLVKDRRTLTPDRARQPWNAPGVLPPGVRAADEARSGTLRASLDPETLLVSVRYIGSELLPATVITKLREDFIPYYEKQLIRMDKEHIPAKMRMSMQETFEQQVNIYCAIVGGVEQAFLDDPGLDHIILNHDLDNVAGVVMETDEPVRLRKKLRTKPLEQLTDDEYTLVKSVHLRDIYDRWVWNPAWVNAVNYVHNAYKDDPAHTVVQGILTTKDQRGLDEFFQPMLEGVAPGVFPPDLIMSSTDGAAERLVPEIITPQGQLDRRGRRVNRITLQQALDAVQASGTVKEVLMERIVDTGGGWLSDYDTKLFMMGVLLDRSIRQGMAGNGAQVPEGMDPNLYNSMFRRRMVMLADDSLPSMQRYSGIGFIHVPRFRTPDSPDIPDFTGML